MEFVLKIFLVIYLTKLLCCYLNLKLEKIFYINENKIKKELNWYDFLKKIELDYSDSITKQYVKILTILKIYKKTKNCVLIKSIFEIISFIKIKFLVKKNDMYYINNHGVADPFFTTGMVGYVYCLLEFYNTTKNKKILMMLNEYYFSINSQHSYKLTLGFGILGALYVLIKYDTYNIVCLQKNLFYIKLTLFEKIFFI